MAVQSIPEGLHSITPYLFVHNADQFVEFLKQAFSATEVFRMAQPDGTIMHAQVRIGDSVLEISEANAEFEAAPVALHLYVDDVESVYAQAVRAGALPVMEPADMFYGDRESGVRDPFGNHWFVATHVEDLEDEAARASGDVPENRSGLAACEPALGS